MFMNRWLTRVEIVELNKLNADEETLVFARLDVHCKSGAVDCFLEQDADEVIGLVRRRPLNSGQGFFSEEQKEDRSVIDFNGTMEPLERIADGLDRLIEVLVPKTAESSTPASPTMLAPTEAAERMRLNEQTVMKWCREGQLQASKVGRKWLISKESVEAYIRKNEVVHGRRGGK